MPSRLKSFTEFDELLSNARAELFDMLVAEPQDGAIISVDRQLAALYGWTRGGRRPEQSEKDSLNFGLIASRALDVYPVADSLFELASFVIYWDEATPQWVDAFATGWLNEVVYAGDRGAVGGVMHEPYEREPRSANVSEPWCRDIFPGHRFDAGAWIVAPVVGGSSAFRQFVRDELFPEIERRYRTTNERSIIGESLAGLFIIETLLVDEPMFTHYIALDPSLWWNNHAMADSATRRIGKFDRVPRSLFIATSKEPSTSVPSAIVVAFMHAGAPRTFRVTYVARTALEHSNIFRALERAALIDALH